MGLLSRVPLALLFFCHTSVFASALPAEVSENRTALSIPVNQYNHESPLPPDPPGFTIHYVWNTSKSLNPLGVYVIAIKYMYGLSLQKWSDPVELLESGLCMVTQQPEYNIIIFTSDEPPGTALKTSSVARVLYEAVTAMATRQPGFYQVAGTVILDGERIGKMIIDSSDLLLDGEDGLNTTSIGTHSNAFTLGDRRHTKNTTELSVSNEIIDPNDKRFKITWEWVKRAKNIPAQDIFSSALNGLAMVAQYDHVAPCEYITALSTSGNAVFHIGRSAPTAVLGGLIARAFYLLINQLFLVQRRFEEVWFYLNIHGVIIADGYIHKVDRLGGGNAMEGMASG